MRSGESGTAGVGSIPSNSVSTCRGRKLEVNMAMSSSDKVDCLYFLLNPIEITVSNTEV